MSMRMSKFTVRFCREETYCVDIKVEAGNAEEAQEIAETQREETADTLEWTECDGNEYEPYIANVFNSSGEDVG